MHHHFTTQILNTYKDQKEAPQLRKARIRTHFWSWPSCIHCIMFIIFWLLPYTSTELCSSKLCGWISFNWMPCTKNRCFKCQMLVTKCLHFYCLLFTSFIIKVMHSNMNFVKMSLISFYCFIKTPTSYNGGSVHKIFSSQVRKTHWTNILKTMWV